MTARAAVVILLVEDSPSDRLITKAALDEAHLLNTLHTVGNGVEALAFLRREGTYADAPRPDLILLDLNLPRMDGREVLVHIKADPVLRNIPVVVLTTSAAPDDVAAAYAAYANSYITKPVDFQRFHEALRALEQYWFEVVTLPPQTAPPVGTGATRDEVVSTATDRVAVLLLEDSQSDALLMRTALDIAQPGGFEIVHITRLADAAPLLSERRFDAIVTDLSLPDAAGLDTVKALRRLATRGEPIVVLTGSSGGTSGQEALRLGADDFLQKNELAGSGLSRAIRYAMHRREARDDRQQRQRMESVGRLAAGVAHDFNNLLAAIAGSAELLLGGGEPADQTEMLQDILATADRGRALTRQLLTFSRRDHFDPRPVAINGVMVAMARLLERLIGAQVTVELELAADLPPVLSDVHHLEQVLMNLGINASDAMPGGGKITIATASTTLDPAAAAAIHAAMRPGEYVQLSVRDSGVGIPDDVRARMFEPFFTTKAEGRGTGLGLATVHEIVVQHGGAIRVSPRDGGGTVFDIYLPVRDLPAEPTVSVAAVREAPRRGSGTILLVEDEPAVRSVMQRVLARQGYSVLVADCAEAAWELWDAQRDVIDLVITDLIMPGSFTARDLAARLATERPALPVIFCSGYSDSFDDPTLALREGENFVPKPYSIAMLLGTVATALARRLPAA